MFSPLSTPANASRDTVVTGTILVPTRVAKFVSPAASVTVAEAPRTPSSPVKRSLVVVVVMPLTAVCVPEGSSKRSVPPSRWVIGPRLSTTLVSPAVSELEPEPVADLSKVTVNPLMAVILEPASMLAPVTGMPTKRLALLATVMFGDPNVRVAARATEAGLTIPTPE